jgi:hypothetical protein
MNGTRTKPVLLQRRSLLRMAGGAAAALPMLELTHGTRLTRAGGGTGIPTRYLFIYCGVSSGRSGSGQMTVPTTIGGGYDLPRSLAPLGTGTLPWGRGTGYGVQDEVSVVSGLTIPWADAVGQTPPPGGRSPEFHYNTVGPLVSGVRGNAERTNHARGPSSDQILAPHLATPDHRHLVYRVQPVRYIGGNGGEGDSGRISWLGDDDPVESNMSPRLAFESLFSTFVPPDDAGAQAALHRRRKILAMLQARSEGLLPRLSAADRERVEKHHEEIVALADRVNMINDITAVCTPPTDPGEDPPIGADHVDNGDGLEYIETSGYSQEDLRAEIMFDLIHMAFACDLSRIATIRMTFDQCFMNMLPLVGAASDAHELSHGSQTFENFADGVGWHVKHFARVVARLRDSTEVDGTSMLDHTAVVFVFEGGYGYDPEAGQDESTHSSENMVAMVAGRVGGLVPGRHISAPGTHVSSVTLSAMQATGAPVDALGDVTDPVPQLFG